MPVYSLPNLSHPHPIFLLYRMLLHLPFHDVDGLSLPSTSDTSVSYSVSAGSALYEDEVYSIDLGYWTMLKYCVWLLVAEIISFLMKTLQHAIIISVKILNVLIPWVHDSSLIRYEFVFPDQNEDFRVLSVKIIIHKMKGLPQNSWAFQESCGRVCGILFETGYLPNSSFIATWTKTLT